MTKKELELIDKLIKLRIEQSVTVDEFSNVVIGNEIERIFDEVEIIN